MIKGPLLGELEQAVLKYLGDNGKSDAKSMHKTLGKKRGISLNTIQSTLERLCNKRLLERTKISYAYVYGTAIERGELINIWINNMIKALKTSKNEVMLSAFVDLTSDIDSKHLQELEELIKKKRAQLDD